MQRYFNYLVLADRHGRVVVHRRNSKDIWQGLYEFVLIETSAKTDTADLLKGAVHAGLPKKGVEVKYVSKEYVHLLTHQRLHAKFIVLKLKRKHPPSVSSVGIPELTSFAFSRLTEKFLHDCRLKEII